MMLLLLLLLLLIDFIFSRSGVWSQSDSSDKELQRRCHHAADERVQGRTCGGDAHQPPRGSGAIGRGVLSVIIYYYLLLLSA
jgi:hypothetical protein